MSIAKEGFGKLLRVIEFASRNQQTTFSKDYDIEMLQKNSKASVLDQI